MWQGEEIITRVGVGSPNEIDTSSDSDVTNTGYYTRKTIDESVNGADNLQMSNGMANYIFFKAPISLGETIKKHGFMIRDCSNYHGLTKGFYRIAVKNHTENEALIKAMKISLEEA